MEELLFLNVNEHKFVYEHKEYLENLYSVQISVPPAGDFESSMNTNDIFFANLIGSESSILNVKNVIKQNHGKEIFEVEIERKESEVQVVTLSDSDSEILSEEEKDINYPKKRKHDVIEEIDLTSPLCAKNKVQCETEIDLTSPFSANNEVQCEIISTTKEPEFKKRKIDFKENFRNRKFERNRKRALRRKRKKFRTEEFIPLSSFSENSNHSDRQNKASSSGNSDCSDHPNKASSSKDNATSKPPKVLRPVVIDGSNIAREHGKTTNSFSCKGIKISVDYFLERGHTNVTALVPNWRRHCTNGHIPTTDEAILEELAKSGRVVFTPSRKVNGKRLTPYDDR